MDKSFEGLLLSIFVHIALFLLLWNAKLPQLQSTQDKTEVTIVDRTPPTKSKAHWIVPMEQKKEQPQRKFKDDADFLSQFTQRVKKQLRAATTGEKTVNSTPKTRTTGESSENKVAGLNAPETDGPGEIRRGTQMHMIHNLSAPQTMLANEVPGVQMGDMTDLNTDQFTYGAFYDRMGQQVRNRWIMNLNRWWMSRTAFEQSMIARHEKTAMFEFLIDPQGEYKNSIIEHTSGDSGLDQTLIEAFRSAAAFPNPPRGLIEPMA